MANVDLVRRRRQAAIIQNNERENKRCTNYEYKKGDRILILSDSMDPKLQLHQGPFKVVQGGELR